MMSQKSPTQLQKGNSSLPRLFILQSGFDSAQPEAHASPCAESKGDFIDIVKAGELLPKKKYPNKKKPF